MSTVLDDLQLAGNTYLDELDSVNLGTITGTGALSGYAAQFDCEGEVERVSVDATLDAPIPVVVGVGERILWTRGSPVPLFAPAATLSGVGSLQYSGSGVLIGIAPTATGVAERELPGSGSLTGLTPTVTGAGAITEVGTGALDAPVAEADGVGTTSEDLTADGTLDVSAATLFGYGNVGDIIGAAGTLNSYVGTVSGAGILIKVGTGALLGTFPTVSTTASIGISQTNDGATTASAASVTAAGFITRKVSSALQPAAASTTGTVIVEGAAAATGDVAPNAAFLSCLGLVITAPTTPVDFPTDHVTIVTPNSSQFYTTAITGQINQQENFATVGERLGSETAVTVDLSGSIANPRYFLFELTCTDTTWQSGTGPLGGDVGIELTVIYDSVVTRIASFTENYEFIYLLNYPSDRTRFYAVRDALTAGAATFYLGGYETVAGRSYGLDFPDTGSLNVVIDQ